MITDMKIQRTKYIQKVYESVTWFNISSLLQMDYEKDE